MGMTFGSFASRVVATKVVALDGTGDFTDIQSAINDLPAVGGVVFIKEGTYTITSTILISSKDNVTLQGTGFGTIIKTTTTNLDTLEINQSDNTVIKDLGFLGTSATGTLVFLTRSINCSIRNCELDTGGQNLIQAQLFSNRFIIKGNLIKNGSQRGIWISDSTECIVEGNIVTGNDANGINIVSNSPGTIVTGNISNDNGAYGIVAEMKNGVVIGNTVQGNGRGGIGYTLGDDSIIMGNTCKNNGSVGDYDGIFVESCDKIIVTNNICIDDQGTPTQNRGIHLVAANAPDRCIVMGNICLGNTTAQITDGGTNTVLVNNITT